MSSTSASGGHSLPPLHQAIPEFHSHNPLDRPTSTIPRKLVERPHSFSKHPTSPTGNDSVDAYHANSYPFPGRAPDYRMSNGLSSAPPFSTDFRSSHSLPPVPGLASSSRGSSLDIETERPLNPSVYSSHHSSRPSSATLSDHDHRGPSHSQDYRYPQSTYRSSSPGSYSQHGHPPYYSHSYGPLSGSQPGDSRGVHSTDGRSPFSPTGSNCELAMDHYDQDRTLDRKRRRGNLPKQVTDLLRSWLNDHIHHPYPTEDEKQMLMAQTGLTIHQISNWFINARRRRVPAMNGSSEAGLKSMTARRLT